MKKKLSLFLAFTLVALANENFHKISKVSALSSNICRYFGKGINKVPSSNIVGLFLGYIVVDSCLKYFKVFEGGISLPELAEE